MSKNLPFTVGVVFLLAVIAVLEFITLRKTQGIFCYPLDDTFIHMAVAKNTALYGNWGVSSNEWVSTSSSPFYTGLLAALYKITRPNVYAPFLLAIAGAVLAIYGMQAELNRYSKLPLQSKSFCICLTLFLGAVPSLAALGMEHTFQIAFTLFFVHSCASILNSNRIENRDLARVAVFGALMVFTRYENAFVVTAACGLLLMQKRFKAFIVIALISALPILLFGLYARYHGGLFIPNSIQIKVRENYKLLLNGGIAVLEAAASISGLLVLSFVIATRKFLSRTLDRRFYILAIFILSSLLHAVFGGFGWFYRYEAYLIVLGSFHLLIIFLEWYGSGALRTDQRLWLPVLLAILLTVNLPLRGVNAMRNFVRSTYNIYEQQYQMAQFIKKYYNNSTIAANDIGAISYYADIHMLDLWGLGNNEVTLARKNGYWNAAFLQSLVVKNRAAVAVVYDSWFTKELLDNWKKAGEWEVSYSFMLGDTKVSFYAVDPAELPRLRRNLEEFSRTLPKDIRVQFQQ